MVRHVLVGLAIVVAGLAGCSDVGRVTSNGQTRLHSPAAASGGSVRAYKLNSKNQLIRQSWTKNSDEAGCHDLWRARQVHRFAQVGFAWCTIYAGDDCAAGSELAATWVGGKYRQAEIAEGEPQIKILPGSNWYLSDSENVEVGSWYCEY